MGRYILGRLAGLVSVLLAVSMITFFLMRTVPGSPFDMMALQQNKTLPDEIRKILYVKYGLDKPLVTQYLLFLRNAVRLDFGYSFYFNSLTIMQIFQKQWPYSIQLGALTMVFSLVVGLGLGIGAGIKQGSWIDFLGTGISLFCMAMPAFVFALFLQIIFSVNLKWLPSGGWGDPWPSLPQMIMPVIANSLGPILVFQRYTKASFLDVIRSNYVRTARAKGLGEARITFIHIFKNALTPVFTVGGPMLASLVTGSIFIEGVFRIPGIGVFFSSGI